MSTLNVDKVDPNTGTALEIGSSGDTVTVPSGATLTLTSATLNLPTTITSTTEVKTNKISPATGVAFALGDSGDTFTVPSGATIVNSGTATGFGITAASFLPNAKPLVFNGNMAVSQRGTSFAGETGVGYYACDRWRTFINALGTHTISQEDSSNPTGFGKSYKVLTTTADASPSGNDYLYIRQSLEGNDVQLLKYGTADAVKLTAGFWVKSNKTGTFGVETQCLSGGTSYERTEDITISSADTWEFKTFVVPANTSNVIDDGNGQSYNFYFWINAGPDYVGTPHASWANQANAGRAGTSTLGVGESTSDYFQITGVQFEVGEYTSSTIPPFRHESYGDNLLRCQRYYQQNYRDGLYPGDSTTDGGSWTGALYGTDFLTTFTPWTVRMRTNPTITWYTRTGTEGSWYAGVYQVSEAVDTMTTSINTPTGWNGTVSNVAANTDLAYGYYSSDAEL